MVWGVTSRCFVSSLLLNKFSFFVCQLDSRTMPVPFIRRTAENSETRVARTILLLDAVGRAALILDFLQMNWSGPSFFIVSPWLQSRQGWLWDAVVPRDCCSTWERNRFQKLATAGKGRPWWSGPARGFAVGDFSSSSTECFTWTRDYHELLPVIFFCLFFHTVSLEGKFCREAYLRMGGTTSFYAEVQRKTSSEIAHSCPVPLDGLIPLCLSFPLCRIGLGFPGPPLCDYWGPSLCQDHSGDKKTSKRSGSQELAAQQKWANRSRPQPVATERDHFII